MDYLHGFFAINGLDSSAGDFKSGGYLRILSCDFLRLACRAFNSRRTIKSTSARSISVATSVASSANRTTNKQDHKGIDSKLLHFILPPEPEQNNKENDYRSANPRSESKHYQLGCVHA
jgi:hypothetical protein